MFKRLTAVFLIAALALCSFSGCAKGYKARTDLPKEEVTLIVAGSWTDCRALDETAKLFNEVYPNCTIAYEYMQDYYAALPKRMNGADAVDLFFTTNIQADSEMLPYVLDLNSCENLDLSETFAGLIENFTFREESGENTKLYAIPLGAEMRGMYVNVTLLKSLGLEVPTNQSELLHDCEVLKENGYIPMHGNPSNFAQMLIYPWLANTVANAADPEAMHATVAACEPGMSELFREQFAFLYSLVENGYYDYKTAQEKFNLFVDASDPASSRDFLNIAESGESYIKKDDVGQVAFLPGAMSMKNVVDKTKEDYHSEIEYVFIPAPVSNEGGFAYLSPAHGIAANKNSANLDFAVEFLNFLFKQSNNEVFAKAFNVIPNTAKAFDYIKTLYDLPESRICHLGQVTFDYGFYELVKPTLANISKCNNPKYMKDDGSGNLSLYPLNYYMDELEAAIEAQ